MGATCVPRNAGPVALLAKNWRSHDPTLAPSGKPSENPWMSLLKVSREVTSALVRGVTDPTTPPKRRFAVLGGFVASGLRLARGMTVSGLGPRPSTHFILWDFERCPHSRIVREALSMLDL